MDKKQETKEETEEAVRKSLKQKDEKDPYPEAIADLKERLSNRPQSYPLTNSDLDRLLTENNEGPWEKMRNIFVLVMLEARGEGGDNYVDFDSEDDYVIHFWLSFVAY